MRNERDLSLDYLKALRRLIVLAHLGSSRLIGIACMSCLLCYARNSISKTIKNEQSIFKCYHSYLQG